MQTIKNIIFDLSEVIISGYHGTENLIAQNTDISKEAFEKRRIQVNDYFLDSMRGNHSEDEYWKYLLEDTGWNISINDLKRLVRMNFNNKIPGTLDLINRISNDYNLILLSDHLKEWMKYILEHNKDLTKFNRKFFSYEYGKVKMDPDIFEYIIRLADINPDETIFIDDYSVNVENAKRNGIDGIVFTDAETLEEYLRKRNIIISEPVIDGQER